MAIKLKKSRPFLVWCCFFIGIQLLAAFTVLGVVAGPSIWDNRGELISYIKGDMKDTHLYRQVLASKLAFLVEALSSSDPQYKQTLINELKYEGDNLLYYGLNTETGEVISNLSSDFGLEIKGHPSPPEGYDYSLYAYNGSIFVERSGETFDLLQSDLGYQSTVLSAYLSTQEPGEGLSNLNLFLLTSANFVPGTNGYSRLYNIQQEMGYLRLAAGGVLVLALLAAFLLSLGMVNREARQVFSQRLSRLLSRLLLEVKAMITLVLFWISGAFLTNLGFWNSLEAYLAGTFATVTILWWLWLNGRLLLQDPNAFWSHHLLNGLLKKYRAFERLKPFQKAMMTRAYALVGVEALLVFLSVLSLVLASATGSFVLLLVCPLIIGGGIYLIYRYLKAYGGWLKDLGKLLDHLKSIREGNLTVPLELKADAELSQAAEDLNRIQSGVTRAGEARLKSERMKVELITNVSHDLKTPLTAIISYVDLLSKEEALPEHVLEYIQILSQKSERLKVLIQDLFDLSKASSGAIELKREWLDLNRLVQQVVGDLDQEIQQSQLIYRLTLPEEAVLVYNDGHRLYRVLLNLLTNTLKYSLEGSRVYVELFTEAGQAHLNIKNTANYEINLEEEELLERFVRGDQARATEGSGLGLAIAESFTRACGGTLKLRVDGDLFKVMLTFPLNKLPDREVDEQND